MPEPATKLDFTSGERTHRWPNALPNGRDVLFTTARAGSASFDEAEICVASLESGERRTLVKHGSCAKYSPTGHLVYMRGSSMMAIGFDVSRGQVCGSAIPVVDRVMTQPTGAGHFSFSAGGLLIYLTGEAHDVQRRLIWIDSEGRAEPLTIPELAIEEPRLSHDGGRVAFGVRGSTNDIWIHDFEHGATTRATFEGDNFAPIWMPDGSGLTFSSNRNGPCQIFWLKMATAEVSTIVGSDHDLVPGSWSPDGEVLLFTEYHPETGADIWMWSSARGQGVSPLVRTRFNEFGPAFAPDGRSFAYTSDESGRFDVYLSPFPVSGAKVPISIDGGVEPVWSRDGRRLYYRSGSSVMAAEIDPGARSRTGAPHRVADGTFQPGAMAGLPNYDVARDGRLLMIAQTAAQAQPDNLSVTVDWFSDLVQRLA